MSKMMPVNEGVDPGRSTVSIVVPVLNERETIARCLGDIRAVDGGGACEIIVVDGDPHGSTLDVITDPDVVRLRAKTGRSYQMNAGAQRARGDVIVFLHADTRLPATALHDIAGVLDDPSVVGGAFAHRFDSPRLIYRVVSALVSRLTRWNRLPYGDQAMFLRREYFERIGGFAPIDIMEDRDLVLRIRRRGDCMRMLGSVASTSCRRLDTEGIARRIVKNWAMTVMYTLGVPPRRLARYYRPHGQRDES